MAMCESNDKVFRYRTLCDESRFRRSRSIWGSRDTYTGSVWAVEYAVRSRVQVADVDPDGELDGDEVDRRLAAFHELPLDATTTSYWSTQSSAQKEATRLLDEADPRLSERKLPDGSVDPVYVKCTRRDDVSVSFEVDGGIVLWRVDAVVREYHEVVERESSVTAVLRRAEPNDDGVLAVLTVGATDGRYNHRTEIMAASIRCGSTNGNPNAEDLASEPAVIGRVVARASDLGTEIAATVNSFFVPRVDCALPAVEV